MRRSSLLLGLLVSGSFLASAWAAPAAQPRSSGLWLERFDGEKRDLASMGWEGGNEVDGKLVDHFLVEEKGNRFLRSSYVKGKEAQCLRKEIEWDLAKYPYLRWRWRARKMPAGAEILKSDRSDAPAQVYLLWRNFPHYFVVKYFWATQEPIGTVLRQNRLLFGDLFGEVIRSGGPGEAWRTETRNVAADFERAFGRKPPGAVKGIAVLSDGDETGQDSEADFDDFEALTTEGALP